MSYEIVSAEDDVTFLGLVSPFTVSFVQILCKPLST